MKYWKKRSFAHENFNITVEFPISGFYDKLFSDQKNDAGEEPVDFVGIEDFTEEDLKVSYNGNELNLKISFRMSCKYKINLF